MIRLFSSFLISLCRDQLSSTPHLTVISLHWVGLCNRNSIVEIFFYLSLMNILRTKTRYFTHNNNNNNNNISILFKRFTEFAFSTQTFRLSIPLKSFNAIIQANLFKQFTRLSPEKYSIHSK